MKILLLGANGQVGHELLRSLAPLGEIVATTRSGRLPDGSACRLADLSDIDSLAGLVADVAPGLVVNATAYTSVDRAEDEPELAMRINAEAPAALAAACAMAGIGIVHFSTDYVFDGSATGPCREDDPVAPLGVYGASKWAGEQAVRESGAAYKIFRLCWVYGPRGGNFLLTMLRLARERDQLRVVSDQVGTPTAAHRIADGVAAALLAQPGLSGTWHLSAEGETSWYGFADEIFRESVATGVLAAPPKLEPIATADYPTRARRPAYSRLDTARFRSDFGFDLGDWHEGLQDVLAMLAGGPRAT